MKQKKICFVHPEIGFKPFSALGTYPLGILNLAATVKRDRPDWDVVCFDEDFKPVMRNGRFEPRILEADAVGITALTATAQRAYTLADKLRDLKIAGKTNPNLQIIIGGMHATFMPDEAITHADAVLMGEGEEAITSLIEEGKGIVQGVPVKDLDSLAEPDYSLLAVKKKRLADYLYGNLASIDTSRGCPYACNFCTASKMFGRKIRMESAERTFEKAKNISAKGFKRLFFHDDIFSVKPKIREQFFRMMIEKPLGMDYIIQDRIDLLQDGDYVEMMARSGCTMVMFGVEVADKNWLKSHHKELNLDRVETGVELLKRNKIVPYAFCMINPENPQTTESTLRFLRHLGIKYAQFTIPTPLPGADIYEGAKSSIKAGWKYFTGLTLVTENGEKARDAAEHLSKTWRNFYSPFRAGASALRFDFSEAALRLYGWYVGRKILDIQP